MRTKDGGGRRCGAPRAPLVKPLALCTGGNAVARLRCRLAFDFGSVERSAFAHLDGSDLKRLRALDQVGDLLTALAPDLLEVTGSVLLRDCPAALLADLAEEVPPVLLRGGRAALLPDLLVELGTVTLAHQAAAHST